MSNPNPEPSASKEPERSLNFIEEFIEEDLAKKRYEHICTRFPPEPNGYLHIGHAKAICIDFGMAQKYGGKCNLHMDDTNLTKDDTEYIKDINASVTYIG